MTETYESFPEDESQNADGTPRKSSSAFRTIGEVATELGLPPHVLRFWESKFPQIKPHKRRGGHRYYRPADIEVLNAIKHLLYDKGYTIRGAQQFLKEQKKAGEPVQQTSLFQELPPAAPVAKSERNPIVAAFTEITPLAPQLPHFDAPTHPQPEQQQGIHVPVMQGGFHVAAPHTETPVSAPMPEEEAHIATASLVDIEEIQDILRELEKVRDLLNAPISV